MKPELFQEVIINRDFPEYKIAKGDVAILNDFVTDPAGEEDCVLEIYTAVGTFVMLVTLPVENIEPLKPTDRLSVRSCTSA
ncbi:DUF4926 domain-containing protein [Chamaesiphon polymorphus]|uniref:DUF4926 domain-containing protein n=1 Tax=Chamaesiphon polymorphus CCALA 037 TaxID=2107692 RepID=A0A2T1GCQ4_9CYAN|nr:DUF4926 domain-containing protein [Chamaesiphon polymorphus]PSB55093.1 DUF4926 domain-containing protein [Chamaesiphon polymorphus CCALA 037]